MKTLYLKDYGPTLIENGYKICAIIPESKSPGLRKDWVNNPLTVKDCTEFEGSNLKPDCGIGIICGMGEVPICCIDLDADSEEVVENFERLASRSGVHLFTYRVGRAPRRAYLFRAETAGWTKKVSSTYEKGGARCKLEILGKGQQFVAYGIHDKTHLPYTWPNYHFGWDVEADPLHISANQLDVISEHGVNALLQAFELACEESGCAKVVDTATVTETNGGIESFMTMPDRLGLTIEDTDNLLHKLNFGTVDRALFIDVGMAIHFEHKGCDEAFHIWDEWASQFPGYRSTEESRKKWDSFRSEGKSNLKTMRTYTALYAQQCIGNPFINKSMPGETGWAMRMCEYAGFNWVFTVDTNKTYRFNGSHWVESTERETEKIFSDYLLSSYVQDYKKAEGSVAHLKQLKAPTKRGEEIPPRDALGLSLLNVMRNLTKATKQGVSALLHIDGSKLSRESDFDASGANYPKYFGVANGDIDLSVGRWVKPVSYHMVKDGSGVRYEAGAQCPIWRKTLVECLGSKEMADFFQRLMGYAATGTGSEQLFAIFYGEGCNGKSTIVNVLFQLFGAYAHMVSTSLLATSRGYKSADAGRARPDLIALNGARLVMAQESEEGAKLDSAFVKATAGGDIISARDLYGKPIKIYPRWLSVLVTNACPIFEDPTEGTIRKIIRIHFPRNFEKDPGFKRDNDLPRKLQAELPGILNWLIEGIQNYLQGGLRIPQSLIEDRSRYRAEVDPIARWFAERCELVPGAECVTKEACNNYREWLAEENFGKWAEYNMKAFTPRVVKAFGVQKIRRTNDKQYCFIGMRLKDLGEELTEG